MTRDEYIAKYKDTVINATVGTGLFPSVMMAQAILESSDSKGVPGNSSLARLYNNHFGIKADRNWAGKKVNLKTREVVKGNEVVFLGQFFRVYDCALESFYDRVAFLKANKRYEKHGVFTSPTPVDQANALQAAGYATDPQYANIINKLITKHKLFALDIR